jgi:Peptidase_C39 like family
MVSRFELDMNLQPDDESCGPTCLHAVYRYYGEDVSLSQVMSEVELLETGGTLAVLLALHALARGYRSTIYTYNLQLFDPTWFMTPAVDLAERLEAQAAEKEDAKLRFATRAYVDYIERGGRVEFEELNPALLRRHLERGHPILTGLSATYLYGCARERGWEDLEYDDVRGYPTGHFVVLGGYDPATDEVHIADPLQDNPRYLSRYYPVGMQRLLGAILLGVLTYDANILILEPEPTGS